MSPQDAALLEKREVGFENFYSELMPALVDFIGSIGINPPHEVLNQAQQYVPYVENALEEMAVADEDDRTWLLTRMGYFIGEYFAQKYAGCWYVNDIQNSRYFGRYVVGKFPNLANATIMVDPFEVAQSYVDTAVPRKLVPLLVEVEEQLSK